MLSSRVFYIAIAAGVVFIAIGIASSVYSNVPVDVPLDNTIRPGAVDVITPDMNVESAASISVSGTTFHIEIKDPDTSDLTIVGHAQTKANPLGLSGALMLVVTGVITIGLGLRFRRHY